MAASNGTNSGSTQNNSPGTNSGAGQSKSVPGQQGKPESRVNKGGLLKAIDKDQESVFGVDEINQRAGKETPDKKSPAQTKVEKVSKEVEQQDNSPADEALRLFEEEFGERKQEKEIVEEEKAPDGLSEDASKRFQKLANERREATQRFQELENRTKTYESQVNQWAGQVNEQFTAMRVENAKLTAKMEALLQHGGRQQKEPDEAELALQQLGEKLDPRYKKMLAPMMNELKQLRAEREQEKRQGKLQQDQRLLNMAADRAASDVLLNGFNPEKAKPLKNMGGSLVMALAWAKGCSHEEAAKLLRGYMGQWGTEFMRTKLASSKTQKEEAQKLPPSNIPGRGAPQARGNPTPTWEDAKKAGFKNPLDMMIKQDLEKA